MVTDHKLSPAACLIKGIDWARETGGSLMFALLDMDHWQAQPNLRFEDLPLILGRVAETIVASNDCQVEYLGRDELAVAVTSVSETVDGDKAAAMFETIRNQASDVLSHLLGNPTTFSAGIAIYPTHGRTAIEIVTAARSALQEAKRSGRGCTQIHPGTRKILKTSYYDDLQLARLRRLARRLQQTEADLLREALEWLLEAHDG